MTCANCGASPIYAKALCRPCFEYRRRTGRDRPELVAVAYARRTFERETFRRLVRQVVGSV